MVVMSPVSAINNKSARERRHVTYRPYSDTRLQEMGEWFEGEEWIKLLDEQDANMKMSSLQQLLVSKYEHYFPQKTKIISSDDEPFFNDALKKLRRRKCKEYHKNRRSQKWYKMDLEYRAMLKKAKNKFYSQKIKRLRKNNPKQWHRELKKLTSFDQGHEEKIIVESINHLSNKEQANLIADKFAEISQEYDKLEKGDIEVPFFAESEIPVVTEAEVEKELSSMDTNKSNVEGDIPAKVLKHFSSHLAKPVANIINSMIRQGCWPDILKVESVTPVPKKFPPATIDELRNISGLLNLDKIAEKIISKMIISDMKSKIDPTQFANQKGLGIQHYLVKMIDKILKSVDKNSKGESLAVLATFVDWRQAFPRQCPKLGVESFIKNGVRPALIPLLINYFQSRKMKVKWHGEVSSTRELNGGGPQGSTFGIWEYLSQSNDNADCIQEDERFKFVDDLSFLEIINLLSVGISSYNLRAHVPSNVPVHNQIILPQNLKSQQYLDKINAWTKKQKMKLNEKKTQNMIFNFSKKGQFTTNLEVNEQSLEVVNEVRLLGTILTNDLKWNKNTREIVKKAYRRMQLLHRAATFTSNVNDLKSIYLTYIRSILEQSAVVWHSSLTAKNRRALERVQKAAIRLIFKGKNKTYEEGLKRLNIGTLEDRRTLLCLKFAKNCLKNEKVKDFFPRKKKLHKMKKRKENIFVINKAHTKRYKNTAIPYMQQLLNVENKEKQMILKNSELC